LIKVAAKDKRKALRDLMRAEDVQNALIFCNRKRDIGVLHRSLERDGFKAGALHGDMDQYSRTDTLEKFKAGEFNLLVCSDVAARGLDVASMSHVFNYDVPTHADDYIHRIGRTGRAGKQGRAITIATPEDKRYLESIAKLIGYPIPPIEGFESSAPATGGEEAEEKQAPTKHQPSARRSHNNDRGSKPRAENKPRAEKLSSTTESAPERRPRPDRPAPATNRDDNNSASVPFGQDEHVPAFLLRKP
jgi:superfamily II DNA/RNA helicase